MLTNHETKTWMETGANIARLSPVSIDLAYTFQSICDAIDCMATAEREAAFKQGFWLEKQGIKFSIGASDKSEDAAND